MDDFIKKANDLIDVVTENNYHLIAVGIVVLVFGYYLIFK